jgi:hypothetical protein
MMHEREKSGLAVVAMKPTNKAERSAAELGEPRAGAEGNVGQHSTDRARNRATVSPGLERIRQVSPLNTQGGSRMRESRLYGSVRGALRNERPYRDRGACYRARICATPHSPWLYPTPYSIARPCNRCGTQACLICRTAVYGPVRTAVWEGRSREAPPYPDRNDAENWNAMYCICGQRGAAPTRSQRLAMNVCDSKWV